VLAAVLAAEEVSFLLGACLISESGFGGHPSDVDLAGVLTIRQAGPDRP
jgi:hypothetical protein